MWNSSLSMAVNLLQTEERKRCKMNQGRSQYGMGKSAKTWENGFHGSIKALNLSIWTWKITLARKSKRKLNENKNTPAGCVTALTSEPSSCSLVSNHPNDHIMTSLESPAAVTRLDLASLLEKNL